MKTNDPVIKITFQAHESNREQLRILAAKAHCNQSEFMRQLIDSYGEALVRDMRGNNFTPESGLPEAPELILCWLTDGDLLFRSAYLTPLEATEEQVKATKISNGNLYWTQSETEPEDLTKAYFRHLERNGSSIQIDPENYRY